MANVIPAGTMVPLWIGMPSVQAKILGISPHGQYVMLHTFNEITKAGEMEEVKRIYYRDMWYIESMVSSWQ